MAKKKKPHKIWLIPIIIIIIIGVIWYFSGYIDMKIFENDKNDIINRDFYSSSSLNSGCGLGFDSSNTLKLIADFNDFNGKIFDEDASVFIQNSHLVTIYPGEQSFFTYTIINNNENDIENKVMCFEHSDGLQIGSFDYSFGQPSRIYNSFDYDDYNDCYKLPKVVPGDHIDIHMSMSYCYLEEKEIEISFKIFDEVS